MKSKQVRDVVFITHRYIGLVIGILASIIGLTGSLIIIEDLWKNYLFVQRVTLVGERLAIETIIANAQALLPNAKLARLIQPDRLNKPITTLWLGQDDKLTELSMNPYTGQAIAQLHNAESYRDFLFNLHIELLSGAWGHYLAGIVGLLATMLCVTGIILWPGWRNFLAGFKIKWNAKIKRLNFDLHKVFGIIAAIFLTMAMFTGFIWNFNT